MYDDRERGASRFLRELAGAVLCPIRAFNRIISGDAWRVRHSHYKYHDYERLPIDFSITVGDRYLADEGAMFRGEHNPYIDLLLSSGELRKLQLVATLLAQPRVLILDIPARSVQSG